MPNTDVNIPYEYSAEILGNFSGGTLPPDTFVPHPISVTDDNSTVTDLSAITIGGINGLNN